MKFEAKPTPLAVLLAAMHAKWDEGDLEGAAALARAAAPYVHPRRATERPLQPDIAAHRLTDAELDLFSDPAGEGAPPQDSLLPP
jgi:hypothetical protein